MYSQYWRYKLCWFLLGRFRTVYGFSNNTGEVLLVLINTVQLICMFTHTTIVVVIAGKCYHLGHDTHPTHSVACNLAGLDNLLIPHAHCL